MVLWRNTHFCNVLRASRPPVKSGDFGCSPPACAGRAGFSRGLWSLSQIVIWPSKTAQVETRSNYQQQQDDEQEPPEPVHVLHPPGAIVTQNRPNSTVEPTLVEYMSIGPPSASSREPITVAPRRQVKLSDKLVCGTTSVRGSDVAETSNVKRHEHWKAHSGSCASAATDPTIPRRATRTRVRPLPSANKGVNMTWH
jgi:hypothetical protein